MKKLILLCCAFPCIFLTSCWHPDSDISISYKDNNDSYSMDAWFGENKTRKVERYMTEKIGHESDVKFYNTRMDAEVTTDDGSKFYIKKSPGHVMIKMNRYETSDQTYHLMKDMCMGMKQVVIK